MTSNIDHLDRQNIDEFNKIQDQFENTQASNIIAENANWQPQPEFDFELNKNKLQAYCKMIHFINWLGWIEHTSDWDPSLIITLKTKEIIETNPGYYLAEVKGNELIVEGPHENDISENDEMPPQYQTTGEYVITIKDIDSIVLYPH